MSEIVGRVSRFVESYGQNGDETSGERREGLASFESLAFDAFLFQFKRSKPYRRLCEARGVTPGTISDWRQIPAVPTSAYQSLDLSTAPPRETFRSSGTTSGPRSVHGHPFPELYRRTIDATFSRFCRPRSLADDERPAILSLVPSRADLPDSSLGFMADHLLAAVGSPASTVAFGSDGVDAATATAWCEPRRRDPRRHDGRPVIVLATAFALVAWLESEPAADLTLPPGSVVFETGGFKGKVREISRAGLLDRLALRLGVPASQVVREYGMTELTSQFYTRTLDGGDGDVFVNLPWLRARILDPFTLEEAAPGEPGVVAIFDLANLGSAVHLLTQDLGVTEDAGFRLLGRASDAELRGCSLTVEELETARGAGS